MPGRGFSRPGHEGPVFPKQGTGRALRIRHDLRSPPPPQHRLRMRQETHSVSNWQYLVRFNFEKGENARRQHSAARKRKNISAPQKERCPAVSIIMTCRRGTAMRALSRAFPFPVILLNKARWGRGGGQGEGPAFSQRSEKRRSRSPLARAATEGGRRPCPLRRRKLRASTAEIRGFPSPQKNDLERFTFEKGETLYAAVFLQPLPARFLSEPRRRLY